MAKLLRFVFLSVIATCLFSCDETVSSSNNNPIDPPPPTGAYHLSKIKESQFSETDTVELETSFVYRVGRLAEVATGEYTIKFHYINDTKVTSADYMVGEELQFTALFHYNEDGQLVQIVSYDNDNPAKTEFTYTDDVLTKFEYKTLVSNGWVTQISSVLTYEGSNIALRTDTIGTGAEAIVGKTVYGFDDDANPYRFLNPNLQKFFIQFDMTNPLNYNNVTSEDRFYPIESPEATEKYTYAITTDALGRATKIRKKNVTDDYVETERNFEYIEN
ncbi:MAG TPA: hypothetical protein VK183_03725 [Flavobacterium sp.]|nr:hypothetical protein [Flavobacterium sp.]